MLKTGLAALIMTILISGCSAAGSHCDGWKKLNTPEADKIVITRDLKEQIAGHNKFGNKTGCW